MNCESFERLIADALGDELSPADRPAFDAHLGQCEPCRHDYKTARSAVETMRLLPGPQRVSIERKGNRLVIKDIRSATLREWFGARSTSHRLKPAVRWMRSVFRYAASVLIAFSAGYALHAGLMMAQIGGPSESLSQIAEAPSRSLRGSLVKAHVRNPFRSGLAKCLIAMSRD